MPLPASEMLSRLGNGEPIASICERAGLSREEFDAWWQRECAARVPSTAGRRRAAVKGEVRIERDKWGLPHVFAEKDEDLFFGFGYAVAQDRLFQLDYLRRRALGRLSEILGPEGLEVDLTSRTVGLSRIAEAEWADLPDETRRLLVAYCDGINALLEDSRGKLPIEFDLLGYAPERWRPQDSLAIAGEFRWYLTGRFPVIVIPELARRVLGEGPLYRAFLEAEADDEAILPRGSYPPGQSGVQPVGVTVNDPQEGSGSNNWVISGKLSAAGKPLVASDPHIAFGAVSCWYEIHLCGGSFNVGGTTYAGVPGVIIGRNERVAFGITNNICSIRDLYQERTDPAHPDCFLFHGKWEPAREIVEEIRVKGREPVRQTIRFSRNGPIVDAILPAAARETGPVSLKWLGATKCGWLTALLGVDRAKSCDELRKATESWVVPTFSVVFGDVDGHIGYQCTGRIPLRKVSERGYRPGWDPQHQWTGLIPFEGMPCLANPPRGWIATANNRVATDDFPYPLSGTWASGHRAKRVRQMLEGQPRFGRHDFARMHQDTMSLRAVDCVPRLVEVLHAVLESSSAGVTALPAAAVRQMREALGYLAVWDCRVEPDRVAATIFNIFFARWSERVAAERFTGEAVALVAGAIGGLASRLLAEDPSGWFANGAGKFGDARTTAIVETFLTSLDALAQKFGPELLDWSWGRLHKMEQRHFLSARGDLARLLDRGGMPVRGDSVSVCNTGLGASFDAPGGAGYRLIVDLSDSRAGLWAIDAGSESGHPGSPHYDDQLSDWLIGRYHYIPLVRDEASLPPKETFVLAPL